MIVMTYLHARSWLIGKDPDAGRDWGQEEKGTTEDEMAGWHHRLDGHESEWTPGVGDGEAWRAAVHGVAKSRTRLSDWTQLNDISSSSNIGIIKQKNNQCSKPLPIYCKNQWSKLLSTFCITFIIVSTSQSWDNHIWRSCVISIEIFLLILKWAFHVFKKNVS